MSSVAVNPAVGEDFRKHSTGRRARLEASLGEQLSSTLLLRERAAPLTVSFGIAALDRLTGGLPRGALTEIAGPASSGRTGVMLAALAAATRRQEVCALVDASDSFDPASATTAGVDLERLLWVRCSSVQPRQRSFSPAGALPAGGFRCAAALEQVLKVADLLLQAGGFGMVVLDLGDIPADSARRVPLTSWFRFRRAVDPTATVLLLIEQEPCAKTCASLVLRLRAEAVGAAEALPASETVRAPELVVPSPEKLPPQTCTRLPTPAGLSHGAILRGLEFRAQVERTWSQRKPPQSAGVRVELRTAV
jgi:recombination protein RecA